MAAIDQMRAFRSTEADRANCGLTLRPSGPQDRGRQRDRVFPRIAPQGGVMSTKAILPLFAALSLAGTSAALSQQPPFPDGPGKEIVVNTCGGCHDINRIRAGYTPAGWNMLQHMMQNMGAPIEPQDWPVVTTYLMTNFPERERPAAVLIL